MHFLLFHARKEYFSQNFSHFSCMPIRLACVNKNAIWILKWISLRSPFQPKMWVKQLRWMSYKTLSFHLLSFQVNRNFVFGRFEKKNDFFKNLIFTKKKLFFQKLDFYKKKWFFQKLDFYIKNLFFQFWFLPKKSFFQFRF